MDYKQLHRVWETPEELAEMLNNKNFYNPLTDEKVSKEDFSALVNTVFKVSKSFVEKSSSHDMEGNVL